MKKKKIMSFKVTSKFHKQLKTLSEKIGRSMTGIMVESVKQKIDKKPIEPCRVSFDMPYTEDKEMWCVAILNNIFASDSLFLELDTAAKLRCIQHIKSRVEAEHDKALCK